MIKEVEEAFQKLDEYILEDTGVPIHEHCNVVNIVYKRIKKYIETMHLKNNIKAIDGANVQRELYNTFITALNCESRTSFTSLKIILFLYDYFSDNLFNESYAYRFIDKIALSAEQLKTFRYLMHLFITTAKPTTRNINITRVDLVLVAESLKIGNAKENLIRFYNITTSI